MAGLACRSCGLNYWIWKQTNWLYNGQTAAMLGVGDDLDVLSPSLASSRRRFLPVGNRRREGQDFFLPVGNSARILLTTYLAYVLV